MAATVHIAEYRQGAKITGELLQFPGELVASGLESDFTTAVDYDLQPTTQYVVVTAMSGAAYVRSAATGASAITAGDGRPISATGVTSIPILVEEAHRTATGNAIIQLIEDA